MGLHAAFNGQSVSSEVELRREQVKQTAAQAMAKAREALAEQRAKESSPPVEKSSKPSKSSRSSPKKSEKSGEKPRRRMKASGEISELMEHLSRLSQVEAENTQIRTTLKLVQALCVKLLKGR